MECSVKDSAHVLGKKWNIEIVEDLALGGFKGFNIFLKKTKGLTPHTLSEHLKELEEGGIIKKEVSTVSNTTTTRYSLTEKGMELHKVVQNIKKWNIKWNKTPKFCLHTPCSECAKKR